MGINLNKIFIVLGGILIIFAILLLFVFRKPEESKEPEPGADATTEEEQRQIPPVSAEEKARNDVLVLAGTFVERFGSYSNQSNYENITDLRPFMTTGMQNWSGNYVKQLTDQNKNRAGYYGITTKAASFDLKNFDFAGGAAEITVGTQRRENSGEGEKVVYQDIELSIKKISDKWLVDGAWWQ